MTITLKVKGMTCGHCVQSVTEELEELGDVKVTSVDLVPGEDAISTVALEAGHALDEQTLRDAVCEAGYDAVEVTGI